MQEGEWKPILIHFQTIDIQGLLSILLCMLSLFGL